MKRKEKPLPGDWSDTDREIPAWVPVVIWWVAAIGTAFVIFRYL